MNLLALDTSTRSQSAAVIENGAVRALAGLALGRGEAERVLAIIQDVVRMAGTGLEAIDAVAVARGPGSLTGLRVGVGTAKGLAIGMSKPLIGVSSLRAIAAGLGGGPPVLALIDAGRGEVYGGLFGPGSPPRPLGAERVGLPEDFARAIGGLEVRIAGGGAERHRALFPEGAWSSRAGEDLLAGAVGLIAHALMQERGERAPAPAAGDELDASPRYLRRETSPIRFEG